MKNIVFSIIIPFYNTPQEYFERLMNLILNKKKNLYEIIIINDGSDIKYCQYLNKYNENPEIKIVNQSNHGVSYSRNQGIKIARGKYIIFLDADDLISDTYFEQAEKIINKYEPDIIFGKLLYANYKEQQLNILTLKNCTNTDINNIKNAEKQILNGEILFDKNDIIELKKCLLNINPRRYDFILLGSQCGNVYKTDLVKKVMFEENIKINEDQLFNRKILNIANKAVVVSDVWYYYLQNEFSAMHNKANMMDFNIKRDYWDILEQIHVEENDELKPYLNSLYINLLCNYLMSLEYLNIEMKFKKDYIKKALSHPLIIRAKKEKCKTSSKKLKFKIFCVKRNFIFLLFVLYKIKRIKDKK